ncbi:uncharacterized protein A4U43_C08F5400 [Asparagus officinalis]|nr:uncharacterized protein A4U43_C08F5400 [Asparagus officinalis]
MKIRSEEKREEEGGCARIWRWKRPRPKKETTWWYSDKFLKGQWDKEECVAEWDKYRACLAQHLEDKHLRSILLGAEASGYTNTSDGFSSVDTDGDFRQ